MKSDINGDIVQYALEEVKDQYAIYIEGFDDIKKKAKILLLVCSLSITLPLSNSYITSKIMISDIFLVMFLSGILCLSISIIMLLISLFDVQVEMPYMDDIVNSIGKYQATKIKMAVLKTYTSNLNTMIKAIERKRIPIRFAEKFIIAGMILIIITIISVLMGF